jgi:hypothetical protein
LDLFFVLKNCWPLSCLDVWTQFLHVMAIGSLIQFYMKAWRSNCIVVQMYLFLGFISYSYYLTLMVHCVFTFSYGIVSKTHCLDFFLIDLLLLLLSSLFLTPPPPLLLLLSLLPLLWFSETYSYKQGVLVCKCW